VRLCNPASLASGVVIRKLVSLLGQILQSEVEAEVVAVNSALESALEKDVTATVTGLLEPLASAETAGRAQVVSFIERALLSRAATLLNDSMEAQTLIADQIKKVCGHACVLAPRVPARCALSVLARSHSVVSSRVR
jgi:hypothetical protein